MTFQGFLSLLFNFAASDTLLCLSSYMHDRCCNSEIDQQ